MPLKLWQIDAFASKPFEGNPAAIVPLREWLPDAVLQNIAAENNLAETAFFVPRDDGAYDLRWFTPTAEVELCGHATLASAWVLFHRLGLPADIVRFRTRSGELTVTRSGESLRMSLPAAPSQRLDPPPHFIDALRSCLGAPAPLELYYAAQGGAGAGALIALWLSVDAVLSLKPDNRLEQTLMGVNAGSLLATAPGIAPYDFVSRFFAPHWGVPEDPVTGSAHCALTPFWAARLGKKTLKARQVSKRGGDLIVTDDGERTLLEGTCMPYLEGTLTF